MVDKSPLKIQKMFDAIAKSYDFLNNIISFGTHKIIKRIAFRNLKIKKNDKVLDLCTGTGDITRIIKNIEPSSKVIGIDFSNSMIEIARKNHKNINFMQGDVCNLQFEDNYFDIVTISFGLRNIENRELALSEINRVLKKEGHFAHLDFSCQSNFFNSVFDKTTLFFAKIFSKNFDAYKYLIESKNNFKNPDELICEFENQGFKCVFKKCFLFNTIAIEICEKK